MASNCLQSTYNPKLKEIWYFKTHEPVDGRMSDFHHLQSIVEEAVPTKPDPSYHDICFDHVMHATHDDTVDFIINENGPEYAHFKGHPKRGYETLAEGRVRLDGLEFVWFSPCISSRERNVVKSRMESRAHAMVMMGVPEIQKVNPEKLCDFCGDETVTRTTDIKQTVDWLSCYYGGSPALLNDESRFGNVGFVVSFRALLNDLAEHHGIAADKLCFYDMGTFTYKLEWMHVILIGPETHNEACPYKRISDGSEVFRQPNSNMDQYHWLVRATQNMYCRSIPKDRLAKNGLAGTRFSMRDVDYSPKWEHLTFALMVRPGHELLAGRKSIHRVELKHNEGMCVRKFNTGRPCRGSHQLRPANF